MNDVWNKMMGVGLLVTIVGFYLLFRGPEDGSGDVPFWYHLIVVLGVFLFFMGNRGAARNRK